MRRGGHTIGLAARRRACVAPAHVVIVPPVQRSACCGVEDSMHSTGWALHSASLLHHCECPANSKAGHTADIIYSERPQLGEMRVPLAQEQHLLAGSRRGRMRSPSSRHLLTAGDPPGNRPALVRPSAGPKGLGRSMMPPPPGLSHRFSARPLSSCHPSFPSWRPSAPRPPAPWAACPFSPCECFDQVTPALSNAERCTHSKGRQIVTSSLHFLPIPRPS
jgi:hypothetical protein